MMIALNAIEYLMGWVHGSIRFVVRKTLRVPGRKIPIMLSVGRGVSCCRYLPIIWVYVLHLILIICGTVRVLIIQLLMPIRLVCNIETVLTDKLLIANKTRYSVNP